MKTINFRGRIFHYTISCHSSYYGEFECTTFYEGFKTISYKKYGLFGPILTKELPIKAFQLDLSIEDVLYSKSDIKSKIEKEVELLNRKAEIERGEII